jgi:hypothetical protein
MVLIYDHKINHSSSKERADIVNDNKMGQLVKNVERLI